MQCLLVLMVASVCVVYLCEDMLVSMAITILPSIPAPMLPSTGLSRWNESMSLPDGVWLSTSSSAAVAGNSNASSTNLLLNNVELSILFGVQGLVQLLCNPLCGAFIDNWGGLLSLMVGCLLDIISCVGFCVSQSLVQFTLAVGLNSLGGAFNICAGIALLSQAFPLATQRRKYIGLAHVCLFIGCSSGPLYGGAVFQFAGQAMPFLLLIPAFVAAEVFFAVMWMFMRSGKIQLQGVPTTVDPDLEERPTAVMEKKRAKSSSASSSSSPVKEKVVMEMELDEKSLPPEVESFLVDGKENHMGQDTAVAAAAAPTAVLTPTPIWRLLMDPPILVCAGGLSMIHLPSSVLSPTLSVWMSKTFQASETQQGVVWLSGVLLHALGTLLGTLLCRYWPQRQAKASVLAIVASGLVTAVISLLPYWFLVTLPIATHFFCIGFIEVVLVPLLTLLVDTRHTPVYGSIAAIAYGAFSFTATVGGFAAGPLVDLWGFEWLCGITAILCCAYCPLLLIPTFMPI